MSERAAHPATALPVIASSLDASAQCDRGHADQATLLDRLAIAEREREQNEQQRARDAQRQIDEARATPGLAQAFTPHAQMLPNHFDGL